MTPGNEYRLIFIIILQDEIILHNLFKFTCTDKYLYIKIYNNREQLKDPFLIPKSSTKISIFQLYHTKN